MLLAVYFVKIHSGNVNFIPKGQKSQYKLCPLKSLQLLNAKLVNLSF